MAKSAVCGELAIRILVIQDQRLTKGERRTTALVKVWMVEVLLSLMVSSVVMTLIELAALLWTSTA